MIYELCLCIDEIIIPYPDPHMTSQLCDPQDPDSGTRENQIHKAPKLAVSLLSVNKRIRDEALPILFGKNVWEVTCPTIDLYDVKIYTSGSEDSNSDGLRSKGSRFEDLEFPDSDSDDSDFVNSDLDDSDSESGTYSTSDDDDENELPNTIWARFGTYIKHLAIVYSYRAFKPSLTMFTLRTPYARPFWLQFRAPSAGIHELSYMLLERAWLRLTVALQDTLDYCPNVQDLAVDIVEPDCALQYYRNRALYALLVGDLFLGHRLPPQLEVNVSGDFDDDGLSMVVWFMLDRKVKRRLALSSGGPR